MNMDADILNHVATSGRNFDAAAGGSTLNTALLSISHQTSLTQDEHRSASTNNPLDEIDMAVISKIEKIFESVVTCILEDKNELTIHLKSRNPTKSKKSDASDEDNQGRAVTFPGKTVQEAWKFTVLLRILEISHAALVNGTRTTKRFLFPPFESHRSECNMLGP